jgi:3-oxoacyl-[acyl-carrier-protein] synthase III
MDMTAAGERIGVDGSPSAGRIGVGAIRCILPPESVAVPALPEFPLLGTLEAEFAESCGIRTVGVFADSTTTVDLAARACRELLADAPAIPDAAPDLLVLVGPRAPDVLLGSDACHIQAQAALPATFSFTIDGLGCTGSSAAWALARDLLLAQPERRSVLITHASRPTGADRVRYPVTVIGDGGYAMTMVRGGRPALLAHRMETDGSFHDLFQVNYKQAPWYEWREECQSPDRYRFELSMHSRLRVARLMERVLADAGIGRDDVRAAVMQNVTASAYEFYESFLGVPIHPVCRAHLERYGHLGAMDVVLNLDRLISGGDLARGDHVLVMNNSPVAAWAVSLWQI